MYSEENDGRKRYRVRIPSGVRSTLVGLILGQCSAQAFAQCIERQKLTASDAGAVDQFGNSVSVDGDIAVIGSWRDDCTADPNNNCGAAYVYRFNGTDWVQEQKLMASDADEGDRFGESVSVHGDTVIIGATGDYCSGEHCGSAYVFRFNGLNWTEEQKLTASDAAPISAFGSSVTINGNTAMIGSSGAACASGLSCGAVYVFRFDSVTWNEVQKLTASNASLLSFFGTSVSLKGDVVVIGAPGTDCAAGDNCGSAYVFRFKGITWAEEQKLVASDAAPSSFGRTVSVDGDAVLVGARGDDCCGSAYAFRFTGTEWIEEQKLAASDAAALDNFGASVSVNGNMAVVGSRGDDCPQGITCGAAYVFHFDGTNWNQRQKLTASDASDDSMFGHAVAVSDDTLFVTASNDDCPSGNDCGSAYVFHCFPQGTVPSASAWGLVCLTFLLLAAGTVLIRRTASIPGCV